MNQLTPHAQQLYQVLTTLEPCFVSLSPSAHRLCRLLEIDHQTYQQALKELMDQEFLIQIDSNTFQLQQPPIREQVVWWLI